MPALTIWMLFDPHSLFLSEASFVHKCYINNEMTVGCYPVKLLSTLTTDSIQIAPNLVTPSRQPIDDRPNLC